LNVSADNAVAIFRSNVCGKLRVFIKFWQKEMSGRSMTWLCEQTRGSDHVIEEKYDEIWRATTWFGDWVDGKLRKVESITRNCEVYLSVLRYILTTHIYVLILGSTEFIRIMFKNSVRTAKKTPHFTVTKINRLTLFKEITAVYRENHTEHVNTNCSVSER
jgi:hypothetical protein